MADKPTTPAPKKKVYTGDGEYEEQTPAPAKKPVVVPDSVKTNKDYKAEADTNAANKEQGTATTNGGAAASGPATQKRVDGKAAPTQNTNPNGTWIKQYHKGTDRVPSTGLAVLKQNEAVLNPADAERYRQNKDVMGKHMALAAAALGGKPEKPTKKVKEIRVRKGEKGGHIIEHHHTQPEHHPMEEHVAANTKAMLAHMKEHMGDADDKGGHEEPEPASESMAEDVGF